MNSWIPAKAKISILYSTRIAVRGFITWAGIGRLAIAQDNIVVSQVY
jgi:hypothetical protein